MNLSGLRSERRMSLKKARARSGMRSLETRAMRVVQVTTALKAAGMEANNRRPRSKRPHLA